MIVTRHLDYLVEADMAKLACFLLVDPINNYDDLAIVVPPTILLAFYLPIAVLSLICGFSLRLALVLVEDCMMASSLEA
jgi:hypothetical protein